MADLKAYKPSISERLAIALMNAAGRFGASRYAQQNIGKVARGAIGLIPGLGDVAAADDARQSWQQGDKLGAGINAVAAALGMVPAAGDVLGKGVKSGGKIVRKRLESFADTNPRLYSPPMKPQRPFAADYPGEVPVDAAGRLTHDIEGRPLSAQYVAGRTTVGESGSGIPTDAYDAIAEAGTGRKPESVPAYEIQGDAGRYYIDRDRRSGRILDQGIQLNKNLTPTQAPRVLVHEIGHAIDEIAGTIPTDGLHTELSRLYNTTNTGVERTRNLTGPQHLGYGKDKAKAQRELIAEAMRACMANPNYIKTVAPRTAARIREYVNSNPTLKNIVQFNSIAAMLAAPAVVGSLGSEPAAPAAAPDSERNLM